MALATHADAPQLVLDEPVVEPKSLIERLYRKIGNEIVRGVFSPGSKIKLEPLSKLYGVSTGTVREALSLLVSDGLVVANSQRGFYVAPMSIEGFQDLLNTRMLLEISALHMSIVNGGDAWEGRVVQAFHKLSLAENRLNEAAEDTFDLWEIRNREFHEALVSACDSEWTLRFRDILYRQSERYRRLTFTSRKNPGQFVHVEHKKIFDLAISRRADEAAAALIEHIRSPISFVKISEILPQTATTPSFEKFDLYQSTIIHKFSKI